MTSVLDIKKKKEKDKYFNDKKKGVVINAKRGHRIRAFVEIELLFF